MRPRPCPECDSSELLVHDNIAARGAYGPDLLPGAGNWFAVPRLTAVVCRRCGHIRHFAAKQALERLANDRNWKKIR